MSNWRAGTGTQLGETDFGGSPYDGLPRRRHARREIPAQSDGLGVALPPPRRRRLSGAERKTLQDRRLLRETPLPKPERHPPRTATADRPGARRAPASSQNAARRGLTLGGLVIVTLTLLAFAAGRFLSSDAGAPPTPTGTAGPVVALSGSQTPVAAVAASPGTATPVGSPVPRTTANRNGHLVVCIDPGHGGPDTGFTRADDDVAPAMMEKELNLRYATDLASRLREDGFRVVMTRTGDYAVNRSNVDMNHNGKTGPPGTDEWDLDELQARIDICNGANANLMISVHINGFPDNQARGYEVWYTGARPFGVKSKYLAEQIDQALTTEMREVGYEGPNRGAQDDINANVQPGPDKFAAKHYVLIGPGIPGKIDPPSLMPGVICEPLFISNDDDANFAISAAGENAIVTAYEQGILAYFKKYPD